MLFSEDLIEQLSMFILRPPRQLYGIDRLGPKTMVVKSASSGIYMQVLREQATILNNGRKLQLSLFQPQSKNIYQTAIIKHPNNRSVASRQREPFMSKSTQFTTHYSEPADFIPENRYRDNNTNSNKSISKVGTKNHCDYLSIFLHSNSGSRLEGLEYAKYLVKYDQKVCLFDYSASGLSEGQYVTMGLRQSDDLHAVVNYLKKIYNVERVCLWGRSMGAVTAVIYASRYPQNVQKLVLDSPFSNFKQLLKQIVNQRTGLPEFLYGPVMNRIEEMMINKTGYNLMEIDLLKKISLQKGFVNIPCYFLISKDDKLVKCSHVEGLYEKYPGEKKIVYLQGSHNKPRSAELKEQCAEFLTKKCLALNNSKKKIELKKSNFLKIISRRTSNQTKSGIKQKFSASSYLGEAIKTPLESYSSEQIYHNKEKVPHVPLTPNYQDQGIKMSMKKKEREQNGQLICTSVINTERVENSKIPINILGKNSIDQKSSSNGLNDYSNAYQSQPKISLSQMKKNQTGSTQQSLTKIRNKILLQDTSNIQPNYSSQGHIPYGTPYNGQNIQNSINSNKYTILQYKNKVKQYNSKC